MRAAVYRILNTKSGKFYIGYSQEFEKRHKSHINMLRRGQHHCIHLQRSWSIDGEESFEFVVLKEFDSIEEAILEEQRLLDEHFGGGMMYNSSPTNNPSFGIKMAHTKEAIKKSAESRRNSAAFKAAAAKNVLLACRPESIAKRVATARKNGTLGAASRKSVIARNEHTGEVKFFRSARDAAKAIGASTGNISMACAGKRPRVKGHLFSYALFELGDEFVSLFPQFRTEQVSMLQRKLKQLGGE